MQLFHLNIRLSRVKINESENLEGDSEMDLLTRAEEFHRVQLEQSLTLHSNMAAHEEYLYVANDPESLSNPDGRGVEYKKLRDKRTYEEDLEMGTKDT